MTADLLKCVLACSQLPSSPAVAERILRICAQRLDDPSGLLSDAVSADPALAARLLRATNQAGYRTGVRAGSIARAASMLSTHALQALCLSFAFARDWPAGFDVQAFASDALSNAVATRTLAQSYGVSNPEDAFAGALLQDMGILILLQTVPDQYAELALCGAPHEELLRVERERLSTDHAEVGAAIARQWLFPPPVVDMIRNHGAPKTAPQDVQAACAAIYVARQAVRAIPMNDGLPMVEYFKGLRRWFAAGAEDGQATFKKIDAAVSRAAAALELRQDPASDLDGLLCAANEALGGLCLDAQKKVQSLQTQQAKLREQSSADALTGLANRSRFEEFLDQAFRQARSERGSLAVLFADCDKLKSINDRYGHETGDRMIAAVSGVLRQHLPPNCMAARYGGDEFALVLPGHTVASAVELGRAIQREVQMLHHPDDSKKPLSITMAVGIAVLDASTNFATPAQLLAAADAAAYNAKRRGGNMVQLFLPTKDQASPARHPPALAEAASSSPSVVE